MPSGLVKSPTRGNGKFLRSFRSCHGDGSDVAGGGSTGGELDDGKIEIQGRRIVLGVDGEFGDGDELLRVPVVKGAHGNDNWVLTVFCDIKSINLYLLVLNKIIKIKQNQL